MRHMIAVFLTCGVLLGCSSESGSSSDSAAPSGASVPGDDATTEPRPSSTTPAPQPPETSSGGGDELSCGEILKIGGVLPVGYEGCTRVDQLLPPDWTTCVGGGRYTSYDGTLFAAEGGVIVPTSDKQYVFDHCGGCADDPGNVYCAMAEEQSPGISTESRRS